MLLKCSYKPYVYPTFHLVELILIYLSEYPLSKLHCLHILFYIMIVILEVYLFFSVITMKFITEYSVKDVLFLQTISKLATMFAVVPSYNYEKRKLTHKKFYRCYALFLMLAVVCCSAMTISYRYEVEAVEVNVRIMDIMVEVAGLILCITLASGSSLWNMKTWHKLITQLSRLERSTNLNTRGTRCSSLLEDPLIFYTLGSLFYVAINLWNLYFRGTNLFICRITQVTFHYIKYVLMNMMYNITRSIRYKYKDLKDMFNGFNSGITDKKKGIKLLRKVRVLNLELDSIVETFNTFFGWPVLFLLTHSFVQILGCLSLLTMKIREETPIEFLLSVYMIGDIVSTASFLYYYNVSFHLFYLDRYFFLLFLSRNHSFTIENKKHYEPKSVKKLCFLLVI